MRRQRQRSPALRKTTVPGMLYRLGRLVSKLVGDELAPIAAPCLFINSVVERRKLSVLTAGNSDELSWEIDVDQVRVAEIWDFDF